MSDGSPARPPFPRAGGAARPAPLPERQAITMTATATDRAIVYQAAGDLRVEPAAYRLEPVRTPPVPSLEEARRRPSRLLAARLRVVDFTGRAEQLQRLTDWRDRPDQASVRLVSGAGGQGKTRLADQFARLSMEAGWRVRVARPARSTSRRRESPPPAGEDGDGLLVLVDYAERWAVDDLTGMIDELAGRERVRILLLARASGLWWSGLSHRLERDLDITAEAMPLPPLAASPDERLAAFDRARDRFAEAMGVPADAVGRPAGITTDPAYGVALTAHMAALAAVDAYRHAESAPDDPARLSEYLLNHELDYWQDLHAHAGGLPTVDAQAMGRTVFVASLTGPLVHPAGIEVAERAGLAREPAVLQRALDAHTRCFPPRDQATVLEPLYPDRLAEDFIALLTPGHTDGFTADAWAATAPEALLTAGEDEGDTTPPYARQAITVLIETAARWEHVARTQLSPLLRRRPRLALAAGGAALVTLAGLPHLDPAVLEAIEPHLPAHHVDLDVGSLACVEALTGHRLAAAKDPGERAKLHCELGLREGNAGLGERARASFDRAVELFRSLPASRAAETRVDHAWALLNQGIALAHEGRHTDAYAPLWEAVSLFHHAVGDDPPAAGEGLATGMDALEITMSHTGRHREALDLAYLVVQARETQPDKDAGAEAGLGRAYLNLGNRLAQQGSDRQARVATHSGLKIFQRLAADDPAAFTPDLARALVNRSQDLSRAKDRAGALQAAEEAARLYRAMAETNPAAFGLDLATSLANLGTLHGASRRYRQAVERTAEALAAIGEPPAPASAAHRATRARIVAKLAYWHAHLGDVENAVLHLREAVTLSRTLTPRDSLADRGGVARALMPTAFMLAVLGRPDEALRGMEAAAELYRHLVAADEAFEEEATMATRALTIGRSMDPDAYGAMMAGLRPELERVTGAIGSRMEAPVMPSSPRMRRVQPRRLSRRRRRT
ncbi:hypothetical protein [Actinoallomurus oryzae]